MRPSSFLLPAVLPLLTAAPGSDITSTHGITIGGTFAPWGTAVSIQEGQAYAMARGKCAFRIAYGMRNLGAVATPLVFKNTLGVGPTVVSTKDSLLLGGLASAQVAANAWLPAGTFDLILRLDAANTVAETNEGNNVVRVRVTLDGKCQGKTGALGIPPVPGDEAAHAPFLPPGTPNTFDTTDSMPVPRPAGGHDGPDSRPSDAAIIIHVRHALTQRLGGATSSIIVQFSGGILTIRGEVKSPAQKRQAEQAAEGIEGITRVNNLLVLRRGEASGIDPTPLVADSVATLP